MSSDESFSDCSGDNEDSGGDAEWISEDGGGWISEESEQSSADQEEANGDENFDHGGEEEDESSSDHGEAEEHEENQDSENYEESLHSQEEEEEEPYHSAASGEDDEDGEEEDESLSDELARSTEGSLSENSHDGSEDLEHSEWSTDFCEYYQSHYPAYADYEDDPDYGSYSFPDESDTEDEDEEPEYREYSHADFFPSDEESYIGLGQGQQHRGRKPRSVRNEPVVNVPEPADERSVSVSPVCKIRVFSIVTQKAEVQGKTESRDNEGAPGAETDVQTFEIIPETRLLAEPDSRNIVENEKEKGDLSDLVEVEYLGAGNFGQVFKMSGLRNGKRRMFAEKRMSIMDPSAKTEQNMLESVSHRHIISYIQSYSKADQLIVLMEFADRGTLTKMVEEASSDPSQEWLFEEHNIWRFISHMSSALTYLHIRNILHRDLKVMT